MLQLRAPASKIVLSILLVVLDTVSLGALAYGQTVLSRIVEAAEIEWDNNNAHSAVYDAEKTADVFCKIMNMRNQLPTIKNS